MPADPSNSATSPRPHFPPVGVALSLLAEGSGHRAELAALELGEARDHAARSALLAAAVGTLALLAGFALTLLFAALAWSSPHREWWLIGLTACYLLAAGIAARALHRRLQCWQPFAEIQNQLHQDCQCLRQLLKTAEQ